MGAADLGIVVGSRTNLTISFWRRPLPSSFETYYIVNSFRVAAERPFLRQLMVGVSFVHSRNRYGDVLPFATEDEIRKDQRYILEAYLDWFVHPRVAVRLAGGRQQRVSNFEDTEFSAGAATIGLRLGWF